MDKKNYVKIKNRIVASALLVSLLLPFVPQKVTAAEQTVGNLVIMVTFEQDSNGKVLTNEFSDGYEDSYFHYCWNNHNYNKNNAIYYKDIYMGKKSSLSDYIATVSDGKVQVNNYYPQENADGSVTTITLPGSAQNYLNTGSIEDSVFMEAVVGALQRCSFSAKLSAAELDSWNSDGYIDNLTILVQGPNAGSFTPHKSNYAGGETICFGLKVSDYNILPTEALRSYGYSVASHEFMHTLGAPDLYRTSIPGTPVGIWDQMAQVSWTAQYPLAYTRQELGWLTISDITTSGDYTLNPATAVSGNRAYILKNANMSDDEYFVVEYRQAKAYGEYDYNIPTEGGLIVYRVNEGVTDRTNKNGDNYIYVFRPNTSENHSAATEMVTTSGGVTRSAVYEAAVGRGNRLSLGSSDMSADCTQNTIFYSDGSNSGIVLDNIRFNSDGTLTFHVEFPNLNEGDYWIKQDASLANLQMISMAKDETNSILYVAGASSENSVVRVYCNRLDGSGWQALGADILASGYYSPKLYVWQNQLYMAYQNQNYQTCVTSWQSGGWATPMVLNESGMDNYQFVEYKDKLWLACSTGNLLELWCPQTGERKNSLQVSSISIGNPSVFVYDGELYAIYADFFASGDAKKGKIAKYSESQHAWQNIYTITQAESVALSDCKVLNDKIYIVVASSNAMPVLISGNPKVGFSEEKINLSETVNDMQLQIKDDVIYFIGCYNNTVRVMYQKDGAWTTLSDKVCSDAQKFDSLTLQGNLYVGSASLASGIAVRKIKMPEISPERPSQPEATLGDDEVVLALPDGYAGNCKIYIDGIEYTSEAWKAEENNRLVSTGKQDAKIAIAYVYNASQIPVGMYVWRLERKDNYYIAQGEDELQNLFSYHGFSVRYTGKVGLRCSYGIDAEQKSQLAAADGTVDYQLKEMGTIVMTSNNRTKYPLVYQGTKVGGGRTFYVENGKIYSRVIRKVNGREQFANVLVGLPESQYATDFVFRPYAILEKDEEQIIVYGPEMARSMYTVCKQILNRGDFTEGSSGYRFLKEIVDAVEQKQ